MSKNPQREAPHKLRIHMPKGWVGGGGGGQSRNHIGECSQKVGLDFGTNALFNSTCFFFFSLGFSWLPIGNPPVIPQHLVSQNNF